MDKEHKGRHAHKKKYFEEAMAIVHDRAKWRRLVQQSRHHFLSDGTVRKISLPNVCR